MAIKISGTNVIDDSRNLTNIVTAATGNSTVTGFANVSVSVNSAAYYVGTTQYANTSGIYATHLGGTAAASFVQNTDSRTLSGNLTFGGTNTVFNNMASFAGSTGSSNTTASAWFYGTGGAVSFDTNMCKRITWNDGAGNFNIRLGHYYNGTSAIYQSDGTGTGGAVLIQGTSDGASTFGMLSMSVAPNGADGAAVTFGATTTLNTTAFTLTSANLYAGSLLVANGTVVNATHLGGVAAADYQTEAGLSGNVATLTSNNATFMNGNNVLSVMSSLRANRNISGGGTITVDASGNVLWSTRFIVISNGRGTAFGTSGYFDITCPVTGTITGVGGATNKTATAAGIPLAAWEALYYILPVGSTSGSLSANFRVASYTADLDVPSDWVLICVRNGDNGNFYFNNGVTLEVSTSYNTTLWHSSLVPAANTAAYIGTTAAADVPFPTGTKMLFIQTNAPVGWTKDTSYNNYALRIVTGTVTPFTGGVAFQTAFTTQTISGTTGSKTATNQGAQANINDATATNQGAQANLNDASATGTVQNATLAAGNNGPHQHFVFNTGDAGSLSAVAATTYATRAGSFGGNNSYSISGNANVATVGLTSSQGSGTGHNHGFSPTPHNHTQTNHNHTQNPHNHTQTNHTHTQDPHDHTFSTTLGLNVNYVDAIICTKA
jgi:hypothetical protein